MSYLIFASTAAAQARSAQAWLDCGFEAAGTDRLWFCVDHPSDGRAALSIPATPAEAQISLEPDDYAALLTGAEHAALVAALPDDWLIDL